MIHIAAKVLHAVLTVVGRQEALTCMVKCPCNILLRSRNSLWPTQIAVVHNTLEEDLICDKHLYSKYWCKREPIPWPFAKLCACPALGCACLLSPLCALFALCLLARSLRRAPR